MTWAAPGRTLRPHSYAKSKPHYMMLAAAIGNLRGGDYNLAGGRGGGQGAPHPGPPGPAYWQRRCDPGPAARFAHESRMASMQHSQRPSLSHGTRHEVQKPWHRLAVKWNSSTGLAIASTCDSSSRTSGAWVRASPPHLLCSVAVSGGYRSVAFLTPPSSEACHWPGGLRNASRSSLAIFSA